MSEPIAIGLLLAIAVLAALVVGLVFVLPVLVSLGVVAVHKLRLAPAWEWVKRQTVRWWDYWYEWERRHA